MSSPLERIADQLDHESKLSADNWLARRVASIESHGHSVHAVTRAVGKMAALILDGRIATDLIIKGTTRLKSENPSESIGEVSLGIAPQANEQRWPDHGIWSPDMAMEVNLNLSDHYSYAHGKKPTPTGKVNLAVHIRTWGKLSEEETEQINSVPNTWSRYGDNGFNYRGTSVVSSREAGEELTATEAEIIMAPLSRHILDYFDIMGRESSPYSNEPGNFTAGPEAQPQYDDAHIARAIQLASRGLGYLMTGHNG